MKYQKGQSGNPAGKKKGTLNKFTTLKQAFLDTFNSEKMGGQEGMEEVFSKNDYTKANFFKIISKMLPSNVDIDVGIKPNANKLTIEIVDGKGNKNEDKSI